MVRWDPGTEERLRRAALELFAEHGYDEVTVTQIAERAGITRRSYFRYFPDKREVLFGGSDQLPVALAEAIRAVDDMIPPLPTLVDAYARVGRLLTEVVDHVVERRAVINASPELQERERTKLAALTGVAGEELAKRGVERDTANLAAQVGTVVFQNAFERWIDARGERDFGDCLDAAVSDLRGSWTEV